MTLFNRKWDQETIKKIVKENPYTEISRHENLKALCIQPFAEDDTFYHSDYHEMTFIVPCNWLRKTAELMFAVRKLDDWLQNEYTTEESEAIFERALHEKKIVMVDFA